MLLSASIERGVVIGSLGKLAGEDRKSLRNLLDGIPSRIQRWSGHRAERIVDVLDRELGRAR